MLYYRRNVLVLSCTLFLSAMSWYQVMPFLSPFLKQMGAEASYWVGLAFAAHAAGAMLLQPLWGRLADTHGRKPLTLRAGFCLAGVYFGMSICRTPLQLVFLRFLNGALTGFIPGSYALIATNTPEERAPRALATAQSAVNAGLVAGPTVGGLLASYWGYRGSMQIAGAAVLISTLLVWWLVQEPNKTSPPKEAGLVADLRVAIGSPVQSSVLFVLFLAYMLGASTGPYLTDHLMGLLRHAGGLIGRDPRWQMRMAGFVFSLPAIAFLLTAHKWTDYGRKHGYQRSVLLGLLCGGAFVLSLAFISSVWLFAALYFVAGVWLAAISPSTAAITCTMVDEKFRGRAYAIQQSAGTFGGLIAPLIAARIVAGWGTAWVFAVFGLVYVIGALVFRRLARKWKTDPGFIATNGA